MVQVCILSNSRNKKERERGVEKEGDREGGGRRKSKGRKVKRREIEPKIQKNKLLSRLKSSKAKP